MEENDVSKFCKFNGDSRGTTVALSDKKIIYDYNGGESNVTRCKVTIRRNDAEKDYGYMIIKSMAKDVVENTNHLYEECTKENMMKKYNLLKGIGINVPPTFRVDEKEHRYLMTDLTNDGKNLLIDNHTSYSKNSIANFDEVKNEIIEVADKAYDVGILLGEDAYAMVIDKKTHEGKVYIVDFGMNSLLISKPIKTGDDSREEALDNAERFSNLVFKR